MAADPNQIVPGSENIAIQAKLIKGLLPAVDSRVVDKPFIINGTNFTIDSKGPKADFASRLLTYIKFNDYKNVDTFQIPINGVTQDVFLCTGQIFTYDTIQNQYFLAFSFTDSGNYAPWSQGVCGGKYYFVKSGVNGIIQYDPITNYWQILSGGSIPANPIYCTQSQGLLVVLNLNDVYWSALDDGTNFTPNIGGPGAQGLSITGGIGIAVKEVYDGFVTYTTGGVLKSEVTGGANIFRHYIISRSYQPINAFCIFDFENKNHIILDQKGFYINTIGYKQLLEPMELWQPEFSEYLFNFLFRTLDLTINGQIRLFYSLNDRMLFLMVASRADVEIAQYAFALYTNRDEWGVFNWPVSRFAFHTLTSGPYEGRRLGYFDDAGQWHMFITDPLHENNPDGNYNYNYHIMGEVPTRTDSTVGKTTFGSVVHLTDMREDLLQHATSGQYIFYAASNFSHSGTTKVLTYPLSIGDLMSFILVGLFRLPIQKFPDEVSTVIDVTVSNDSSADSYEDYMDQTVYPTDVYEDYLTTNSPDEDWGFVVSALSKVEILSTVDGTNIFANNNFILTLREDTIDSQVYVCNSTGIWHAIGIYTAGSGQTFHLKLLELSAFNSGRL